MTESNEYFEHRIAQLQEELEKLNILDHPERIVEICKLIRMLRTEIGSSGGS